MTETRPRNAIVILMDSLNRRMLGAYGGTEFDTPNLDRFARRALRFDRHFVGSLPCMPARHDILCGALDFLWKPWGSVEMWESPVTYPLRLAGIPTMLVTDHPHLFETGGENYHTDFFAWRYERGHESDPWRTRGDPSWIGCPGFGRGHMPYDDSRGFFRGEEDFPGPRTMAAAAEWLDDSAPHHDRFLLFVDEFDPHEPFDSPEPYASMYDPDWEGPHLIWPPYTSAGLADGVIDERQARQIRACYGGKLTMIDHHFGKVLDAIDRQGLWDGTAIIVCTDHGHYLGEKDVWGKPRVPLYETLGHIPLLIAWPGIEAGDRQALTTSVDIHATLLDVFGVEAGHRTHGRSLVPIITEQRSQVREHLLAGIWGREVHLIDPETKYVRGPAGANAPLSMWSNRWSTMPMVSAPHIKLPRPNARARLDCMPGSDVPVIRQDFLEGDPLPYWAIGEFSGNHLWDLRNDPEEREDLVGSARERRCADQLYHALREVEAPEDHFLRLGYA